MAESFVRNLSLGGVWWNGLSKSSYFSCKTLLFIMSVARMQCGPSRLMQYQRNPPNSPIPLKRSANPYKMYDAGEIVYDKDGVPLDTTKNVVQAFDS